MRPRAPADTQLGTLPDGETDNCSQIMLKTKALKESPMASLLQGKLKSRMKKSRTTAAQSPASVSMKELCGGSCRIRTYDQLVKSQLLYQLS